MAQHTAPRHTRPMRPSRPHGRLFTAFQALFVACVFALLVAPLALMPVAPAPDEATEKRELAPAPRLMGDDGPNLSFLSDAGAYFADHFAFRSQLVDLDATIRQRLFLTSATPNVVVGTDGWLYYAGELGDYQRTSAMSDVALDNAAHNLALIQETLVAQGKRFALVVAPNKSTAAPTHLPYYLLKGDGASNLERLLPKLEAHGVAYVDATAALKAAGEGSAEGLYFARDSHWNDAGARAAYEAVAAVLGQAPLTFDTSTPVYDKHLGDLDQMLHPVSATAERQEVPEGTRAFTWLGDATDVEESYLATQSTRPDATGTLIMYRDSFGNNLIGPFASTYQTAIFTKRVPYNLGPEQVGFARDVVIERAERHLASFATTPPYMPAPARTLAEAGEPLGSSTTTYVDLQEPYLVVEGTLDEAAQDLGRRVFVELEGSDGSTQAFECFRASEEGDAADDFEGQAARPLEVAPHVAGDAGYRAFVAVGDAPALAHPRRARILVGNSTEAREVARLDL